jgi:hypothetical protein
VPRGESGSKQSASVFRLRPLPGRSWRFDASTGLKEGITWEGRSDARFISDFENLVWLVPVRDTRAVRVTLEGQAQIWRLLRIAVGWVAEASRLGLHCNRREVPSFQLLSARACSELETSRLSRFTTSAQHEIRILRMPLQKRSDKGTDHIHLHMVFSSPIERCPGQR